MCGICGIYGGCDKPVQAMMATLAHRGPDSSGSMADSTCSLGHTRLSILDLSENGIQPMTNENRNVWLVVNGEIYNYTDLRAVLHLRGHHFTSESDSEVILHLYESQGLDFVKGLRGMFALALYDQTKRTLILARDPIGKKPLYYAWHNNRLVFGSEIKALFAAGVPKAVNYDRIPDYLMYQYIPGEQTLFAGVKKMLPGHMMIVSPNGYEIKQYWTLTTQSRYQDDYTLRDLLDESVHLRLQSDVPVGAFLSGGIDSSAVVALWRQQYSGLIYTFTASFPSHSEAKYARKVSKHLETTYHEVEITPEMVAKDLNQITWHNDEPLGDAAIINTYYLAREAKKHVTVVLAGEGGDELFGGYSWYHHARTIAALNRIPLFLRFPLIVPPMLIGSMANPAGRFYSRGRQLAMVGDGSADDMAMNTEQTMSWPNAMWILNGSHKWDTDYGFICPDGIRGTYNRMLALDCLNLLPEKFLMKADRGCLAWAVEERLPLLDKHIIEYAFGLPESQKKDKRALRDAVKGLLPLDIVERPKAGFGTPQREWLDSDALRPMVEDRIQSGELLREVCRPGALSRILKAPANILWTVFALSVWDSVWFGGNT